jgi:hypothetical protein
MISLPQNSKLPSIPLDDPQSMLNLVKESTYKASWTNPLGQHHFRDVATT